MNDDDDDDDDEQIDIFNVVSICIIYIRMKGCVWGANDYLSDYECEYLWICIWLWCCGCIALHCKIGVDGPSLRSKERKEFKINGSGSSFRMARFHSDIADLCINHSTYSTVTTKFRRLTNSFIWQNYESKWPLFAYPFVPYLVLFLSFLCYLFVKALTN